MKKVSSNNEAIMETIAAGASQCFIIAGDIVAHYEYEPGDEPHAWLLEIQHAGEDAHFIDGENNDGGTLECEIHTIFDALREQGDNYVVYDVLEGIAGEGMISFTWEGINYYWFTPAGKDQIEQKSKSIA